MKATADLGVSDSTELLALREFEHEVRAIHAAFSPRPGALDRESWARLGRAISDLDTYRRPGSIWRRLRRPAGEGTE